MAELLLMIMGLVKNRIGDSQLTIEFLDRYKPREIERPSLRKKSAHLAITP
jgi:hypothetical protein